MAKRTQTDTQAEEENSNGAGWYELAASGLPMYFDAKPSVDLKRCSAPSGAEVAKAPAETETAQG